MSSWVKTGHRPLASLTSGLLAVTLLATLAPTSAAAPDPVFPSAAEVAAAQGQAQDAASRAAAIDAELAAARAADEQSATEAQVAAEAYNRAAGELEDAEAAFEVADRRARDAAKAADDAELSLSRYAAEMFQGGSSLGQLDLFFGGGPGETLDRALGLDAVGGERARVMAEAAQARGTATALGREAQAAKDRLTTARDASASAMAVAKARNDDTAARAAATATRAEAALTELAALRQTSVDLERQRQAGLAAVEQARIEAENRRRAEEAARIEAARVEAARQQAAREEAARQAAARAEAERVRAAAAAAAAAAASSQPTPRPTPSPTPTSSPSTPTTPSTPSTPAVQSGGASTALAFARAQLGEPYLWGGTGPDAWDCSGLTMKSWAAAGVRIPRVAESQYYGTKRVLLADLLPGDLVFQQNSSGIYHVAMYVGNGQVIHAPQTGDVVKYKSLYAMRDLMPYGGRV